MRHKYRHGFLESSFFIILILYYSNPAQAQFIDHFDGDAQAGWITATGDGEAIVNFTQRNGVASLYVDATQDRLNLWWAIARHRITGLNMSKLALATHELRVETRIRVSHAPRRVNLHVNHQRTTDFHSHLMEYDISDTTQWHTISMTTRNFQAQPGDTIHAHLAMMDWGLGKYRVDFDYFKVDVVDRRTAPNDMGNPLPYHPAVRSVADFPFYIDAAQDAIIDTQFSERNFYGWKLTGPSIEDIPVLSVSGTQIAIIRWDVSKIKNRTVKGSGVLELTPYNVQRSDDFNKDFGMVRICEITGGDPQWTETSVTMDNFRGGRPLDDVINAQMIIDDSVTWNKKGKMSVTLSQPVLQRLIDGQTKGIAIKPLGSVNAVFLGREINGSAPRLYFQTDSASQDKMR